ncbi:hypothetical protein ACN38_g1677 [Penicillium nordicum]|uniref:Uncharacterized protein n=1 Tax=Penicillium nordicum TaxID=229535 RepID=A0A0M8PFX8_9EURO|nr:hypothetical protein ACN38_g1677 [Penicillium nordicum]
MDPSPKPPAPGPTRSGWGYLARTGYGEGYLGILVGPFPFNKVNGGIPMSTGLRRRTTYRGPGSKPFWEGFMPECLNLERQKN